MVLFNEPEQPAVVAPRTTSFADARVTSSEEETEPASDFSPVASRSVRSVRARSHATSGASAISGISEVWCDSTANSPTHREQTITLTRLNLAAAGGCAAPADDVKLAGGADAALRAGAEAAGAGTSEAGKKELTELGDERFVQLLAVLNRLPKHGLYSMGSNCPCGSPRPSTGPAGAVASALREAASEYPSMRAELDNLEVVYADADCACLVSHPQMQLFTVVRGTDVLTPRDLGNDVLVAVGASPMRVESVRKAYCKVRQRFPNYVSYGTGYSLGGTVMTDLAYQLEKDTRHFFARVDVFNAGGSPLRRRYTALHVTEFNAHRAQGDILSYFYQAPGRHVEWEPREDYWAAHSLGHFLPEGRRASFFGLRIFQSLTFTCCGQR
eukprot:TRINITY_DN27632_c0_g1_i1.p1 TRINITY_DN27632_c0_g1~~TRINITY_DN27632_c0_g1_i1.p1  ORF type:complete len:405 (+),score=72.06 TRINITY_DN27632_c0_g1_i1:63-1217(+)